MSDQNISKSDLFPELKHNKLVDAAQRWITKYPFINRVRLYKNPSYKEGLDDKYILIFETEKLPEKKTDIMLEFWGQFSEGPASGSDFEKDLMNAYEDDVPVPSDLYSLWRSSINQPGEDIFDEGHPEPWNTQSGISEKSNHWLLTERTMSKPDSNMNIAELIENAKGTGYIDASLHLIHVLANDLKFLIKHLPYLWTRFGCDTIRGDVGDLSNNDRRVKLLLMFLSRITYGFLDIPTAIPENHNGFTPDHIDKYSRVSGSDKPQQVSTGYLADRGYNGLILKTDDIRAYLMKYAKGIPVDEYPVLLRQAPMPGALFQSNQTTETTTGPSVESFGSTDEVKISKKDRFINSVDKNILTEMSCEIVNAYNSTMKYIPGSIGADAVVKWSSVLNTEVSNGEYKHLNPDILSNLSYAYADSNKKRDFIGELFKEAIIGKYPTIQQQIPSAKICAEIVLEHSKP
ncbi:MAG: hypothetical protein WC799_22465 [Desulfobacteraceae bacterium]